MVHHNTCPLCASEKTGLFLNCRDHFVSSEEFSLFKCGECNFIFTQNYPEENEIGQYYESEEYISHSDTSKGFSNKLYRLARRFMLKRKRNLVVSSTGKKRGVLLDIGSGTGYFVSVMNEAGWQVKGIEINEKARNFTRSHFGLDIDSPTVLSTYDSDSFDCITLWHVLEHFNDPFKYMSEILRVLKPGAYCVIALPNSRSYDANFYKSFWAAWDVPRHLWHFSPDTFRLFAGKTGFILKSLKVLPLDVFYISQLSEKYKGSALSLLKGITKGLYFAILSLFNKERSSSVIYILRKPV